VPDIQAVGGIALRDGCLLLIKRAHPPSAGSWSLPGGRVEPGETAPQAVARELLEETGLVVTVGELVGEVTREGPNGLIYLIKDYWVTPIGGELRHGDDADDAAWVPVSELDSRQLSPGLLGALTQWHVLEPDGDRPPRTTS
jgi:8-oxo-dGTP diphosphatase